LPRNPPCSTLRWAAWTSASENTAATTGWFDNRIAAIADLVVDWIEARRADLDDHFVTVRDWNRHLVNFQHLGAAEAVDVDCLAGRDDVPPHASFKR
jgi:hypothetical protein